jgi:undecaprenyl diphosphate synthase
MKKIIPHHLGIIIDGNRRWARERRLPTFEGHRRGLEKLKEVGKWCKEKGVKILTIYAFSTENWNRSKEEVSYLMKLLKRAFSKKEIKWLNKEGIKLQVIGQRERLPESLQQAIREAEVLTKNNQEGILNLAISYGGRAEICQAVQNIFESNEPPHKITEDFVSKNLWTADLPDLDLIIRTGGEQRISNFLLWRAAYAEFYFSKKYWPAFTEKDLDEALADYAQRQRRFGK